MGSLSTIANILIHLYTIFLLVYSSLAAFALIRFGQSRILSLLLVVFYILIFSSLYFQALYFLAQI